jgi:microcystin-dependent protein
MSGAKLFFYEVGTSTKKTTYSDKALTTPHTNPVVADSSGRWDPIYLDGSYKVILTASTDTDPPTSAIRTWNNISTGTDTAVFGETESITATTAIDATYQNKHLRCTNTISLNLLDIATAGEGFAFSMVNDGTGLVTIDPNGSEEINDTTTWVIPPGGSGICIAGTTEWSFIGTMGIVQSLARGDIITFDANKKAIRVPGTAAAGDIFYIDSSLDLVRLAKGTSGNVLVQGSSIPSWGTQLETGDVVWSYCASKTGFVLLSGGTIGSVASSATLRANADTETLYTLLWNQTTNTELVIQDSSGSNTTRGASAAADFAANKRLPVPDWRGRAAAGRDDMGGTSANRLTGLSGGLNGDTLAATGGTESHTLTISEMPAHDHDTGVFTGSQANNAFKDGVSATVQTFATASTTTGAGSTDDVGGGTAHNNVQPTIIANAFIKL